MYMVKEVYGESYPPFASSVLAPASPPAVSVGKPSAEAVRHVASSPTSAMMALAPSEVEAHGKRAGCVVAADGTPFVRGEAQSAARIDKKEATGEEKGASRRLRGPMRKGKWTPEEETYTWKIIHDFNKGLLPLPSGTTLRHYLSERLNCDPMRITKKFAGAACIGKRVFQPCERTPENLIRMGKSKEALHMLEQQFLNRLESSKGQRKLHSPPVSPMKTAQRPVPPTRIDLQARTDEERREVLKNASDPSVPSSTSIDPNLAKGRVEKSDNRPQHVYTAPLVSGTSTSMKRRSKSETSLRVVLDRERIAEDLRMKRLRDSECDAEGLYCRETSSTSADLIEKYSQSDTDACGLLLGFAHSVQSLVARKYDGSNENASKEEKVEPYYVGSFRPMKRAKSVTSFV